MCSLLALFLLPTLSHCVTVTYEQRADIISSKSKVELQNTFISCGLNDIAIISAPVAATKALYYLHKPNHEIIKLNLPRPRSKNKNTDKLTVKYINKNVKIIYASGNTRVVNPSYRHSTDEDVVKEEELRMKENEFMIGPMLEEDHGNWVLSVYLNDVDNNWIEMFQVITVEITGVKKAITPAEPTTAGVNVFLSGDRDSANVAGCWMRQAEDRALWRSLARVPLIPKKPILKEGDEFSLSFAYPIKNLESCELSVPNSTYDRFYDRSPIDMERCGYVVKNVTKADEGLWEIYGIGRMVFYGQVFLRVGEEENDISNNLI